MGALNPLLTSLLLRDSLQGRDRAGLFTATAAGPVRYDDAGLIVEPAVTNYVLNPIAGVDTSSWSKHADIALNRVTSLPAPLPGWLGTVVTTGFELVANADISGSGVVLVEAGATLGSAIPHTHSWYVYVPSAFSATQIIGVAASLTGATANVNGTADMGSRNGWQRIAGTVTPDAGDLSGAFSLRLNGGTMLAGERLYFTCAAVQPESVLTSPAVGSMGAGYAWAGTAHNSVSTRAETGLSIPNAGHISALRGALVARVRLNDAPSGQREIVQAVLFSGTAGSDFLALNRGTGATSPRFQSRSNGGSFISANAIGALSVGQRAAVWGAWTEGTIAAAVGTDGLVSAARDVPVGTFGSNDIQIGRAAAGSALLSGLLRDLLIYDAPLSDARRAIVLDALDDEATEEELWGLFAGNPYTFFQLRPY